ncbi:MAG: MFS transporter [Anaerolineales bacterium]|uniref:MFS transporter n=1 Tax=Candidatus Villigracilis affinis TaxID=3140682 RepID=UPI001D9598C4|nr:MFS transporter [Anaerolineales bacterium]MBK9600372.1 MFS transporter [Anaerolineales bacterium]
MKNHSLFATLRSLRGNPRGCVYFEPLWGIPFNLYAPYVSIYMIALGMSEKQIGLIVSISWVFQIFLALISGVVTDKIGRRLTTLISDILSWSIPALISAVAQNFWYFLIAGVINSIWRISHTSWSCLLVEDADQDQLVDIYTWIYIANLFVGFIAPLTGVLIGVFSFVPTMRGLYVFAAVMFTLKAVLTYQWTEETAHGKIRLQETKDQSVLHVFSEYKGVLRDLMRAPQTLFTAGIMLVMSITSLINGSFWSILVTEKLQIATQNLAIFPFVKSAIMLVFYFTVMPVIGRMHFKLPMTVGFLGYVASQVVLVNAPSGGYGFLIFSVFLEACSVAAVSPLIDQMIVLTVDAKERARILSILSVGIILLTSPFGWIAGTLSTLDKDLPFLLNITLFVIGTILAYLAGRSAQNKAVVVEAVR